MVVVVWDGEKGEGEDGFVGKVVDGEEEGRGRVKGERGGARGVDCGVRQGGALDVGRVAAGAGVVAGGLYVDGFGRGRVGFEAFEAGGEDGGTGD